MLRSYLKTFHQLSSITGLFVEDLCNTTTLRRFPKPCIIAPFQLYCICGGVTMPRKPGNKPEGRPCNASEQEAWDKLIQRGWFVTRRGWPDFACFKDGKLVLIEVKHKHDKLKYMQLRVMRTLAQYGIPCYRWSPEEGFERVGAPSSKELQVPPQYYQL